MSDGKFLRDVWRTLARLAIPPHDVADIDAWRQAVAYQAQQQHLKRAQLLIEFVPEATAHQIAEAIRTDATPDSLRASLASVGIAEAQAQAMKRASNPDCRLCHDTGWTTSFDPATNAWTAQGCSHPPTEPIPGGWGTDPAVPNHLAAVREAMRR
jgi:hypothetical protein